MAAAVNNMPRNKRPLPKNTVAEETIFAPAEPIAQHADEPQERDAGERHEIQCHSNRIRVAAEPSARLLRIGQGTAILSSTNTASSRTGE